MKIIITVFIFLFLVVFLPSCYEKPWESEYKSPVQTGIGDREEAADTQQEESVATKTSDPSACDCAEMVNQRIGGTLENLTKTPEEKAMIESDWELRLAPCEKKIQENLEFEQKMQSCLMLLFENDNKDILEIDNHK